MKNKVLNHSNIYFIDKFQTINEEFFNEGNMTQLTNSCTNKNLKTIINFVYNVVTYVLSKDGKRL